MAADRKQRELREHVLYLLKEGGAHASFEDATKGVPVSLRGKKPKSAEHSPWMILEHLRIAQWDILEFSRDSKHKSPEWPTGYWPTTEAPANDRAWNKSLREYSADFEAFCALVADESTDLLAKLPHATGQTILREALLIADHRAYHIGEMVLVRRLLGCWK